jgi:hypothetical protein
MGKPKSYKTLLWASGIEGMPAMPERPEKGDKRQYVNMQVDEFLRYLAAEGGYNRLSQYFGCSPNDPFAIAERLVLAYCKSLQALPEIPLPRNSRRRSGREKTLKVEGISSEKEDPDVNYFWVTQAEYVKLLATKKSYGSVSRYLGCTLSSVKFVAHKIIWRTCKSKAFSLRDNGISRAGNLS